MSDDDDCNCPPEGLPAYMGTFADLMALLMCFFVLLLSFSEMDVLKFKQLAGSMNQAFGVQNKLEVKDIPKGTSIVAQEFSPGKPQPTIVEAVMQETVEVTRETIEFDEPDDEDPNEGEGEESNKGAGEEEQLAENLESQESQESITAALAQAEAQAQAEAEKVAISIATELQKELSEGLIELRAKGATVMIRIREKGSFSSASDTIERNFIPVIHKIEKILANTSGEIRVAGHTDNLPIDNEYFRSNWELSGGRAASVTRELLKSNLLNKNRFVITGYADTKPIADNATSEGRSANRRVEIMIIQGNQSKGTVIGIDDQAP